MRNVPIKTKLIWLVAFMSAVLAAAGWVGLSGMRTARASLETVEDRLVAAIQLAAIGELVSDARREMLVSVIQHRPNHKPPMQDEATEHERRAARIEADLAEMNRTWREYTSTSLTSEEKQLAHSLLPTFTALVEKGIKPGIAMLKNNDMAGLDAQLRNVVLPLDGRIHEAIHALVELQDKVARAELARNASDYRIRFTASLVVIALAVLAAVAVSAATITSVTGTTNRLRESERRYRTLFEQAAVGVAEIDPMSGRFLQVNKRYCDIVGLSMDEMLATDFQSITHRDDLPADLNNMKSLIAGEITEYSMDKRYVRKDGEVVWVRLTVYPIWISGEKPTYHIAIVEDITKRKNAENALRSSEEKFSKAFHATPNAILISRTSDGLILEINEAFCVQTGYPRDEVLGRTTLELNFWADPHDRRRYVAEVREHGMVREMEAAFRTKSGRILDGMVSGDQFVLDDESCLLTIIRDVTGWKKADAELRKYRLHLEDLVNERTGELEAANKKLKELDRLKSMFIASMSHELRTPLNSIIGFTGMTLQGLSGELNDEQKDNLSRSYHAARHLLSLITDVIDISKIEAGRIETFPEAFTLSEIIDEAVEIVRPQQREKRLDLIVEVPVDVELNTDRKRLLQCLLNFLSNAVKFTESGTITVAGRETDGNVTISVRDTGIGIAGKDMPKLFEAFERLDTHLRVKAGGTGLGLYLTRKIARDILHGDVSAQSSEGEGSTFTLSVPKDLRQLTGTAG